MKTIISHCWLTEHFMVELRQSSKPEACAVSLFDDSEKLFRKLFIGLLKLVADGELYRTQVL